MESADIGVFGSLKDLVAVHWSFIIVSIVLGIVGNFFKNHVWTKEKSTVNRFWRFMRATLPLHAPFAGLLVGIIMVLIFGVNAPASPGVDSAGKICLYYMGSGVASSWIYNAVLHYLKGKGIEIDSDYEP